MGLNINEIKQARCHYITMGRGRKGVIKQGCKNKKECGPLPKEDGIIFPIGGIKKTPNQTFVDIPEEALNELRQMNPRDVVNFLVNQ